MLKYSILRLALFGACLGLLWLLGLRSPDQQLLLVALAALISMGLSFFLLRGPRDEVSDRITERLAKRVEDKQAAAHDVDHDAGAEDAEAEIAERTSDRAKGASNS
jgi:hypothetical protein